MKKKVAAIALINESNEILLQLRDNKPNITYPNHWVVFGGHVKEESVIEGLRREIKEEINYDLKKPIFLGIFDDKVGNDVYMYKEKIEKKLDELTLGEGQRFSYFNYNKAIDLLMPEPLKEFLQNKRELIFNQKGL